MSIDKMQLQSLMKRLENQKVTQKSTAKDCEDLSQTPTPQDNCSVK